MWPVDDEHDGFRIDIGDYNYFNRDVTIDACGLVKIGSHNMFRGVDPVRPDTRLV
jgi:hypothetical protein